MSRVKLRKRHPTGDTIKRCRFCGADLTGTDLEYCDICRKEISREILEKGAK